MKQFFSQYRKCLRFYSSFLQIFSILFLIISMTLGIFFVYVFRQENHNLQQAAEHSYLNILESTSTTLELTMQNLQQIMLDTIWTSDFTNALVVPFDDTYDRTRNILEHLQQLVDVYPFIRSAFLYCPTSQMVYGSDLTYQPVEEASNELFQNPEHLLSYSGARLSKSHTSFFIKQLTGKTIICQHLYPDYLDSLGALIIELDLASFPLSSIFNPESSSRLPCFITDTNGLPIFRGELPSSLASLFPLAALSSVPAQTVLYAQNGLTYFYHRSSSTSWSYILQISTSQLQFYTPLSQIILFCILGLVCSVLLSVLIASKANQPIRRLLFEAGPSSRSPDVDAENSVPADHPWQLKDLERGGPPYRMGECCGFLIDAPEGRLYFPGDTRLMEYHLSLTDIDVLALDVSTCEYHLNHTSAIVLANHFPKAYLLPFHYGTYDCPTVASHCGEPEDIYPWRHLPDDFYLRGCILPVAVLQHPGFHPVCLYEPL